MMPAKPPPPPQTTTTEDPQEITQGSSGASKSTKIRPAPEHGLKCPRCDSPNTKFCYYNNYSLTQPRHFCKTCRRYWTNGGALRNVPIGGGCRKNKKIKTSTPPSSTSRLSCDSVSSSELGGGLRFLQGLSTSVEFQLGGLPLPFPSRLQNHHPLTPITGLCNYNNQFSSFGDVSVSATTTPLPGFQLDPSSNSLIGLNYPLPSSTPSFLNAALNVQGSSVNLASSIESLSNINQDLHLKLQQQRLAIMFGSVDNQKVDSNVSLSGSAAPVNNNNDHRNSNNNNNGLENQTQKLQPVLFQNIEVSKAENLPAVSSVREGSSHGETQTEWFFGNSYSPVMTPTTITTNSGANGNNNWANGVNAWSDLQQPYSALP
ncbi:hypothetical protein RJT34_02066 [Clitoria ternatea]|uniref:Dof zinc finger protein n=1 Tax=Clitoria ternatea TaxID=43366 RepID=A0AAN9KHQ5_CLITE